MSSVFSKIITVSLLRRIVAVGLTAVFVLNAAAPPARACGPSSIDPIYVFTEGPDLPFEPFVNGKIGIVQSTFGRKTLAIAYRYLNGGSFTAEEQKALVLALKGKSPEGDGNDPLKAWVATRKEFLAENEKLPQLYAERRNGGYDFFPNCSSNAFEVATETLKDRATSYGRDDRNVRAWLSAQDVVFQNCAGGSTIPAEAGKDSPTWLQKDREYQIGAAQFYSLKFDEARKRFEAIAADAESPWQSTADYLVARTLVRHASLSQNEVHKSELYRLAEICLQRLLAANGEFNGASKRLMGLVKYRVHPEERVRELAQALAYENGNDNLRQDLIDYVWLVDRFEAKAQKEEELKRGVKKLTDEVPDEGPEYAAARREREQLRARIYSGEVIEITIYLKQDGDEPSGMGRGLSIEVPPDTSKAEVFRSFESQIGKKLSAEEEKMIREAHAAALSQRQYLLSPNRKLNPERDWNEVCSYDCPELPLASLPKVLRADDLTDWMLTFQSEDSRSYAHALSEWRSTRSHAWLALALAKANKTSPRLENVMREGARVGHDSASFPTVAYHLVRLKAALGRPIEARRILDDVLTRGLDLLPVSAQNQFMEQRMRLAENVSEFFQFARRKPVAFFEEGRYGRVTDFLEAQKTWWNPENYKQTEADYHREVEEIFKTLLPWDDRANFDESIVDIFNTHFPMAYLASVSRDAALPDYLQRRLVVAAWIRAILLKDYRVAQEMAREVPRLAPEMAPLFESYLKANTNFERDHAALYILLKFPRLSPFVESGIPSWANSEELDYYFQSAWWCAPTDTDYTRKGEEVPKIVPRPSFLSAAQMAAGRREREELKAMGDAKSYLGKQVLAWAKAAPKDERLPEALYIAVMANSQYKYGCDGWSFDETTREQAATLLRKNYPRSAWTEKLSAADN